MEPKYHYASVSVALDELNENGFNYDFKSGKKGVYVAGFAANSINETTQALLDISTKARKKIE